MLSTKVQSRDGEAASQESHKLQSLVRFQVPQPILSGCSLVWLKAPALGAGDREFESHFPDHCFMLKREITPPNSKSYSITLDEEKVGINYGGEKGYTVYFDSNLIEPLIPVLQEFVFWQKASRNKDSL